MERVSNFDFGDTTAAVFDDMLSRSVPFYEEVQYMITELASAHVSDNAVIYDLGCSTGTTMLMLGKNINRKNVTLFGLDNSEAMLEKARHKLKQCRIRHKCKFIGGDLNGHVQFSEADVFIMNLTLQFVRPLHRDTLIRNIYNNLKKGGCLIIIEKILSDNSMLNRLFINLYYEFKERKGYSKLEIAQKREALENVLVPYTIDENIALLKRNGFGAVDMFFKWYNFAGLIAVKV